MRFRVFILRLTCVLFDFVEVFKLCILRKEAGKKAVFCKLEQFCAGKFERLPDGEKIGIEVASKVGRIIRVDHHPQAGIEELLEVVILHAFKHAELGVRQRADGQGNLLGRQ